MKILVTHNEERVCVTTNKGDTHLSTSEAFALVTELLKEIDGARAYGEWLRGEVQNPQRESIKKYRRKIAAQKKADPA